MCILYYSWSKYNHGCLDYEGNIQHNWSGVFFGKKEEKKTSTSLHIKILYMLKIFLKIKLIFACLNFIGSIYWWMRLFLKHQCVTASKRWGCSCLIDYIHIYSSHYKTILLSPPLPTFNTCNLAHILVNVKEQSYKWGSSLNMYSVS